MSDTNPDPEVLDPATATVAEVNAHLEEHPEQAPDILAAEADGKARVGILDGPHVDEEAKEGLLGRAVHDVENFVSGNTHAASWLRGGHTEAYTPPTKEEEAASSE